VNERFHQALDDCHDPGLLTTWLTRAVVVDSVAQLLIADGDSKPE
jgi:hypothetical protein